MGAAFFTGDGHLGPSHPAAAGIHSSVAAALMGRLLPSLNLLPFVQKASSITEPNVCPIIYTE